MSRTPRRSHASNPLWIGACHVDLNTGRFRRGTVEGCLTDRERTLLRCLADCPGSAVPRDVLFEAFGYHPQTRSRAVDKAMYALRSKLEAQPTQPRHLVTVHGVGYVLQGHDTPPGEAPPTLLGRTSALAQLDDVLHPRGGCWVITGSAGVGKSRLARHAVRAAAPRFAGGTHCVDLHTGGDVAAAVAARLGLRLDGDDPGARLRAALLHLSPALWLFDDVEPALDALTGRLTDWQRLAPHHAWIVTSRLRLPQIDAHHITLDRLDAADAAALFRHRAPHVEASDESICALVEELDGIPLAIELAATRCRVLEVEDLRERLATSMDVLRTGTTHRTPRQRSLRACLDVSWPLLSDDGRRALAAMTVFVGGCGMPAAERVLAGVGVADPVDAVQELIDAHLIRREQGRFVLSRAVQLYAAEQLCGEARDRAQHAHQEWADGLARLPDAPTAESVDRRLLPELDNLLAAHHHAVTGLRADAAIRLALLATALLELHGPSRRAGQVLDATLELATGHPQEVRLLRLAGVSWRQADRPDRAVQRLRAALDGAARQCRDTPLSPRAHFEQGQVAMLLGWTLAGMGRDGARTLDRAALESLRTAVHHAHLQGDATVEALANYQSVQQLMRLGRIDEVIQRGPGAIHALQRLGHSSLEGEARTTLARAYRRRGALGTAVDHLSQAVRIHAAAADGTRQVNALRTLACAHYDEGRLRDAQTAFERCIDLDRALGNEGALGNDQCNLAEVSLALGDADRARTLLEQAIATLQRCGRRTTEARTASHLASLHLLQGRTEAAAALLDTIDRAALGVGAPEVAARVARTVASVALSRSALARASEAVDAAHEASNLPRDRALAAVLRSRVDHRLGHRSRAMAGLRRAIAELRAHGPVHGLADALEALAELRGADSTDAQAALQEAAALFERSGDPLGVARCRVGLAELAMEAGRPSDAEGLLEQARATAEAMRAQPLLDRLDELAGTGRQGKRTCDTSAPKPA